MLYIKMMADEDKPDTDQWKDYTMFTVESNETFSFEKEHVDAANRVRYYLQISKKDGSFISTALTGNVYIMNEQGKTIASHGS